MTRGGEKKDCPVALAARAEPVESPRWLLADRVES